MSDFSYILVDYENVQPKDLELLQSGRFKVMVFLGPQHMKISTAVARALQPLGTNVEYFTLEKAGRNASDFRIVYFLGKLSGLEPAASFYVISEDDDSTRFCNSLEAARSPRIATGASQRFQISPQERVGTAQPQRTSRCSSKPLTILRAEEITGPALW
ncbi:MAG TPA: PIN domain-containing protein [Verrucomicrobiae bacterium]|nr:PIN domain-containing protein [Verrucomicrobiae bacterium]